MRIALSSTNHDGYLNDGEQDDKTNSARIQFLVQPSNDLKVKLGLDYVHQGQLGGGYALVDQDFFAANPVGVAKISAADRVGYLSSRGQTYFAARGRGTPTDPVDPHFRNSFMGANLQIDWETSIGTITIQPAYRYAKPDYYAINSFSLDIEEEDRQFSLETRITSKSNQKLRWIVGAFALSDDVSDVTAFDNFNKSGSRYIFTQKTESLGAFADATYNLSDNLRLLAGIRYTRDSKVALGTQFDLAFKNPIPLDGDKVWNSTNYRAGFQYDVNPRAMVYGTVATGYHAGGFYFSNVVLPTDSNSVGPEKITAYTLGAKTRLFSNKMLFNIEAFRWELEGQQVSLFTRDSVGATIFATYNAGRSTNQGAQLDIQYRPVPNTNFGAQIQYLDAVFNNLQYSQAIPVQPGFLCQRTGAPPALKIDCSGLRPPQAPELSVNLNFEQTFKLANNSSIIFAAKSHYQSETIVGFNYLPDDVQEAHWIHEANLTFKPEGDKWSVSAFVDNMTDEVVKSNATHNGNVQAFQLRPPRTYGVRFHFEY